MVIKYNGSDTQDAVVSSQTDGGSASSEAQSNVNTSGDDVGLGLEDVELDSVESDPDQGNRIPLTRITCQANGRFRTVNPFAL